MITTLHIPPEIKARHQVKIKAQKINEVQTQVTYVA